VKAGYCEIEKNRNRNRGRGKGKKDAGKRPESLSEALLSSKNEGKRVRGLSIGTMGQNTIQDSSIRKVTFK